MKFRLIYLFTLLVAGLALLPTQASAGISMVSDLKYEQPSSAYSGTTIASLSPDLSGQTSRSQNGDHSPGTQIRQSADVAIQGSIVPACDVILSLIAVLHLQNAEPLQDIVEPPTRQALLKVLFQVIIAPNAP